jgi:hypothetical protein
MKSKEISPAAPKRPYNKPRIEHVRLDNEISMVMATDPPPDPDSALQPQYSNDPFKISMG